MTSMHGTDFDIMQSIAVGSGFGGVWGRVMRWRGLVMTREGGRGEGEQVQMQLVRLLGCIKDWDQQ